MSVDLPTYKNLGVPTEGITLRDYFAGQVLAGFMANPTATVIPDTGEKDESALAKSCYILADALLKVRKD